MSNDLERPLGQNLIQRSRKGRPSSKIFLIGLISAAFVGGSAMLALQGENYRAMEPGQPVKTESAASIPSFPADAAVEAAKADKPANMESVASSDSSSMPGPKIIKVKHGDGDVTGAISISDPSKMSQDPRVAHIPDPDLIDRTDAGALPVRAADGRRPLDVYARPSSGKRGAKVAIIIGGLGISQTSTQSAIRSLPPEITLAFAPQGNSLPRWAQSARRSGHEILLQVPMEPFDYPNVDPGRGTLLVDADPAQNLLELRRSLGRITNYTGVLNYMGARFTSEKAAFQPVINDLAARGLLFVDDGTSARSQTADLMKAAKGTYATGDFVIDAIQDKSEIMKRLDELEASARATGSAIATGTAFDTTVAAVAEWSEEAKKRGIEIVGVSALAHDSEK